MRRDAIIDKKQVPVPNASHLGYDKWKAQVGDLVLYLETDVNGQRIGSRLGRMIGRVKWAPQLAGSKPIRNWIILIALSDDLSHSYERWVNPEDVLRVQTPRDEHKRTLDYVLGSEILKAHVNEVRMAASDGWKDLKAYREWKGEISETWSADDFAKWENAREDRRNGGQR